jgi:beta-phosphoglucomutase-like phosphatase (HAD superfamily)
MLKYSDIQGAIFDVDETLLNNHPDGSDFGLHEQSRLIAVHTVGKRHDSPGLIAFTPAQSTEAFRLAKVHTVHSAIWQMLIIAGEVHPESDLDMEHTLLKEIAALKEEIHEELLRTKGVEVPGALSFVQGLTDRNIGRAVASTACRRDIDIFFEAGGFNPHFSDECIISRERFSQPKPHPEPFDLAFAALGLPEEARPYVVAFEDDPRGLASARAAGLFTCAITTRFPRNFLENLPPEAAPHLIADSYAEFDTLFS